MFDDRYRYTQVPSPLVQPGGMRGLLDFGSTTVIGEESDVRCDMPQAHKPASGGTAPKAHNVSRQKPLVTGSTASRKKKSLAKIAIIVVAVIVALNLFFGALASLAVVVEDAADEFGYRAEQVIDDFLDNLIQIDLE